MDTAPDTDADTAWAPAGWNARLLEQFRWHWEHHLRPRFRGLSDAEYFWEPAADCWSVRPRSQARAPEHMGSGDFVLEFAPEPDPAPVTTIAWRLAHLVVGVLEMRNAAHFDGPACDYQSWSYAGSAGEALEQLDEAVARWCAGVRSLGEAGLERPCGASEGPYAAFPMADLVLHIHRELIHHGAEICLLRDLYRTTLTRSPAR